jgi:hypothetical protein
MTDPRDELRRQREPLPELRPAPSNKELAARGEKYDAGGDGKTRRQFAELTKDEVARIPVLQPGAQLEQGSVYLDLDDIEAGPFVALGSEDVTEGDRIVSKRDADYEIWKRLAGSRQPRTLRPA